MFCCTWLDDDFLVSGENFSFYIKLHLNVSIIYWCCLKDFKLKVCLLGN